MNLAELDQYADAPLAPHPAPWTHRPVMNDIGLGSRSLFDANGIYLGTALTAEAAERIVNAVNETAIKE